MREGIPQFILVISSLLKEPLPKGVLYSKCDITDENSVASLFKESSPQVVYNLAGFANLDTAIKFPRTTMELNVLGNINVLR